MNGCDIRHGYFHASLRKNTLTIHFKFYWFNVQCSISLVHIQFIVFTLFCVHCSHCTLSYLEGWDLLWHVQVKAVCVWHAWVTVETRSWWRLGVMTGEGRGGEGILEAGSSSTTTTDQNTITTDSAHCCSYFLLSSAGEISETRCVLSEF